jgi:ubiquinone/menaquinone biosynthesis C-methylase UbiE
MREDVQAAFGPVAANYARSAFHADPARLQEVIDLSRPRLEDLALDVATGTGNTALALAPHVRKVIGLDLTREMLEQARSLSAGRGVANVEWLRGDACRLPFGHEVFDLYTVRAAPHHFHDLDAALAEAVRVLRPGGRACFVDCTPPRAARDHLHPIEVARDPSHVLSLTLEEWMERLEAAGLRVETAQNLAVDWDFEGWMATMAVPAERVARLAGELEAAAGEAREELRPVRRDQRLFHNYWHSMIRARRAEPATRGQQPRDGES